MLPKGMESNKGVFLFIIALIVTLAIPPDVSSQLLEPKKPQDKLKRPRKPKIPAYLLKTRPAPLFTPIPSPQLTVKPAPLLKAGDEALKPKWPYFYIGEEKKPRIRIESLEIHPYGGIENRYDSNIYLQPHGLERGDWIMDSRAGIAAKKPLIQGRGEDYLAEGFYHADLIRFWDQHKLSRIDHTGHGSLQCVFPNDFAIRASDDILKTQDPPNNERTALTKRWQNMMDQRLSYMRDKIRFEGAYTLTTDYYNSYKNLNKNNHMFTSIVFYNIFPKTWMLGEFNSGMIKYYSGSDTNSNSRYYQGRLGVEGLIAPKLTGSVKAGYRYEDYFQKLADNFSDIIAQAKFRYELSRRTTIDVYGFRGPEESSYYPNSYYEINTVGVTFDHLLMRRLWLNGGFFWELDLYPARSKLGTQYQKRNDTLYGPGIRLRHEIKDWLFVEGSYQFQVRDSNFKVYDYRDNKYSMRVSVEF